MAILLSITPIKIPDSSCTQSWILTINHSQASPKDIDWNSVANINKLCDRSENVSFGPLTACENKLRKSAGTDFTEQRPVFLV